MSNKPKYFATYHGPSYNLMGDVERVMGFASLADAKDAFRSFYSGSVGYGEYQMNAEGFHVPWSMGQYVRTPATTLQDHMDLYMVLEDDVPGQYLMNDEIKYRLTWGPRGGIVVEK